MHTIEESAKARVPHVKYFYSLMIEWGRTHTYLSLKTYTTMKNIISYTAILALALTAPLSADIVNPAPTANTAGMRGNCDLLASNTVRATFVGLRDMTVQTIEQDTPSTVQVAVFEVIDSLGYRKYVRYGDGQLTAGTRFTIAMNRELPGQPSSVVDTIAAMQPGEEAVLKIDHLYLLGPREGSPIRACSRMVRRNNPVEATAPAATQPTPEANSGIPTTVTPLGGGTAAPQQAGSSTFTSQSTRFVMGQDANGNMQSIQIQQRTDASGQTHTRMFINGVEVDPQTRQPLTAPQPSQTPEPKAPEQSNDDTIIDQGPAPQQPVPGTPAPQPQGSGQTISESDSF